MRTRLLVAACIAAATAAVFAQSTTSNQQEQPKPTFRAEANYVRVDMYPTQNGGPIDDLTEAEIEILEDGVPQKIATFEHVKVRPPGDQASRIEPNTVEQSRQATSDPRARVFVIFLDTHHIQFEGAHMTRRPIVQFLDRVIGQDDLVAVMTPEMSAGDITFGRKTTVISKMLDDAWLWGRRDHEVVQDPHERSYELCFDEQPPPGSAQTAGIAYEMKQRRREKLTFDALEDLIRHLAGIREERKAVLTISEGWRLFGINRTLSAKVRGGGVPTGDPIYVGPDGKLRRGRDPRNTSDPVSTAQCEAERNALAEWDGRRVLYDLFDRANRGNVSFYTVYARGLAVFDEPISSREVAPIAGTGRIGNHDTPSSDSANLRSRLDSLRALSDNTDGLAIQDTNAIESAMQRIVSDLTSYYLVGYYSSNPKIDGKFREITVRVKRPGVKVRARRGYRAPTAEQLTEAAAAEKAKPSAVVTKAFDTVAAVSPRSQLRLRAASWHGTTAGAESAAAVWIVGEVDYRVRKELAWSAGAAVEVLVVSAAGADVASKTIDLPAGVGAFALRVPEAGGLPPGEYAVRVKVKPKQDASLPVADAARVIVAAEAPRVGEALLWRRGPTTGPKFAATADPRFQRSERVRVEHPTTAAGTATGRLLDRAGQPLNIPVQVSERQDASGEFRWLVAEAALAPLAPGDYAVEVTLDDQKALTAFKVVP